MQKQLLLSSILSLALLLSACGTSSSDDSRDNDAYLQFYNGSANSAPTTMSEADGTNLGTANYSDATSVFSLRKGTLELDFFSTDADGHDVLIHQCEVTLRNGEKLLVVLSGDYESPSFKQYRIERQELDDHFRLLVTSLLPDGKSYDLYMSYGGAPFSAANFLASINYQNLDEMTYWEPDAVSTDFDAGEYVIYVTEVGQQTPIFASPIINFAYATEYVLALRTSTGAIQGNLEIDLLINSSLVTSYADAGATSQ